ncbi:MAG: MDR family MFS transporter [Aeromicrobium sp.]
MATESRPQTAVGLRSDRGPILIAVMLSVGLVAIDATILATAVPSIVKDLGGFSHFPWLFSIYLLAQAVSVPIYGKFADMVGRKPIMLLGIALFVVGSVLCGVAWSMGSLIAFRAIQGLGAGAVAPMAMTIIGDIYSLSERARVQGYVASVWGISSVIGPTLGGVFSDYLSWRWIFFVNVPVGAAAAFMLWRRFSEDVTRKKHAIDYTGAVLLTVGCSLIILGLLEGGVEWAWRSATSIIIFVAGVTLLVLFAFVERRATEPILPPWVFGHRVLNGTSAASLVVGVLLIGVTSYVPLYAQSILGRGALVAGLAVAALTIGWPIAAAIAGRFYLRIGFRDTALMGSVFVLAGSAVLLTVDVGSTVYQLAFACFVIGIGLGFIASPSLVAAQSSVDWQNRGVVTGNNLFARSIGSAVGVAAFGAIANGLVTHRLGAKPVNLEDVSRGILEPAIHDVYVGAAIASVVLLVAIFIIPRRIAIIDR